MLATDRRMSGGAMPDRTCRLSTLVGFRQPVIALQLSLRVGSSFLDSDDLSQTGHAYSAAE